MYTTRCRNQNGETEEESSDTLCIGTKNVSHSTDVHRNRGTQHRQQTSSSHAGCVCAPEDGVHVGGKTPAASSIDVNPQNLPSLSDTTWCTSVYVSGPPLYMCTRPVPSRCRWRRRNRRGSCPYPATGRSNGRASISGSVRSAMPQKRSTAHAGWDREKNVVGTAGYSSGVTFRRREYSFSDTVLYRGCSPAR